MESAKIDVYGAPWCPDCKQAKQFLGEQRIHYEWVSIVDLEEDPEGAKTIQGLDNGRQISPIIICDDGSIRAEPGNADLA